MNRRWPYVLVSLLGMALLTLLAGWLQPDDPVITSSLHGMHEFETVWCQMTSWIKGSKVMVSFIVLVGLISSLRVRSLTPLALVLLTMLAAASDEPGSDFYERKAEGWFWYQDPLSDPEPAKAPSPTVPTASEAPPAPFTVDWVRQELPKVVDRAWDNPSPQNIQHFLILQQFVMNRAEQFRNSTQQVVMGDPWLDETSRRPLGAETGRLVNEQAGKARHELLATLSQRAGLWFFYRSGCPYCEGQAVVMDVMRHHYGFTVIAVTLDGQPLGNGMFPDYRHDRGQAQRLQVQTVPATFLVSPAGRFSAISQGELALNEMQSRILVAALREGWVSQDEYDRTRPVLKPTPAPVVDRTNLKSDTRRWSEQDWAEFLKQAQ